MVGKVLSLNHLPGPAIAVGRVSDPPGLRIELMRQKHRDSKYAANASVVDVEPLAGLRPAPAAGFERPSDIRRRSEAVSAQGSYGAV